MATQIPIKLVTGGLSQYSSTDTVPVGNLATGSPSNAVVLRGDGTWAGGVTGSFVVGAAGITSFTQSGGSYASYQFQLSSTDADNDSALARIYSRVRSSGISASSYLEVGTGYLSMDGTVFLSGTYVPLARLGSGTTNSTTFLRGDSTWATPTTDWASPGAIGSTTPNTGKFTTAAAGVFKQEDTTDDISIQIYSDSSSEGVIDTFKNSDPTTKKTLWLNKYGGAVKVTDGFTASTLTSTVATGTAPVSVTSTTLNTNLNADLLDGQEGSYYRDASNLNAGTVGTARLGSGTANSSSFLRGDQTWAAPPGVTETTGTWTPSLGGTSSLFSVEATYTKHGRMVFVDCTFTVSSLGTGSTNVISGLPFQATQYGAFAVSSWVDSYAAYCYVGAYPVKNTTTVQIVSGDAGGTTSLAGWDFFKTGTAIIFSGWYTAS